MKKFFIHNGTEHHGPFDLEDLKTKGITKDTPVWYQGLKEWTIAGEVDELKEVLEIVTPPPFIGLIDAQEEETPHPQLMGLSIWRWIQILSVLLLIVFLVGKCSFDTGESDYKQGYRSKESVPKKVMTVEEVEALKPLHYLATGGTFKSNFWGHKIIVQGVIKSSATAASYKGAVVRVISYDETQKELSREDFTLPDTIKPYSEVQFELKIDKTKDVDSVAWKIVQAKPL